MGGGVDKPDDRSLLAEGQKTLDAQEALAQQQFELYSKWAPQYAAAGSGSYLSSLASMYPQMSQYVKDADSLYRQGMIGDISNYGSAAVGALRGVNGTQAALMDEMGAQALADLKSAGDLSARDQYDASQLARSAGAARGNIMGNGTIFQEYLNNENLKRERQDRARNYASGVADMENAFYTSPALSMLTASSSVPGLASNAAMQSAYGITPSTYDPFQNAYAMDLYNTNYNANYNAYLNSQNNLFGALGGMMNMGGSIGGAMAGGS